MSPPFASDASATCPACTKTPGATSAIASGAAPSPSGRAARRAQHQPGAAGDPGVRSAVSQPGCRRRRSRVAQTSGRSARQTSISELKHRRFRRHRGGRCDRRAECARVSAEHHREVSMLVRSLAVAASSPRRHPPRLRSGRQARRAARAERTLGDHARRRRRATREILDGAGLYALEAPFRAHDAATVPLHFTQAEGAPDVRAPDPRHRREPGAGRRRVRRSARRCSRSTSRCGCGSTPIRTSARSSRPWTGETYMTGGFVRASGGCSAPALKDAEAALAALGEMKVRWFDDARRPVRRAARGAGDAAASRTTPACSATRSPSSSSRRISSTPSRCARATSCCSR